VSFHLHLQSLVLNEGKSLRTLAFSPSLKGSVLDYLSVDKCVYSFTSDPDNKQFHTPPPFSYKQISSQNPSKLTLNLPTMTIVAQPFNVIKRQLKFNPVA
jgi:hypothetical protein